MRLAKYLAQAGIASRRKAELLITSSKVKVNGVTVTLPQTNVTPDDKVTFEGATVGGEETKYYLLLDKPAGYLSSVSDPHGRKTVLDLVKGIKARIYPVGRLDFDTEGLLLLTNDGELSYRLTHPSFQVIKTYRVKVQGVPRRKTLAALAAGVEIEGERTSPAVVRLLKAGEQRSLIEVAISEGRKRQVKKMCSVVGHPVIKLRRIGFAFLDGSGLKKGQYRRLTSREVNRLYELVGLKKISK